MVPFLLAVFLILDRLRAICPRTDLSTICDRNRPSSSSSPCPSVFSSIVACFWGIITIIIALINASLCFTQARRKMLAKGRSQLVQIQLIERNGKVFALPAATLPPIRVTLCAYAAFGKGSPEKGNQRSVLLPPLPQNAVVWQHTGFVIRAAWMNLSRKEAMDNL